MSDTVSSIILGACRRIGILPEEQDIPDYMVQRGLEVFNDILDEWAYDRIFIPFQSTLNLSLQTNQETYTIGNDAAYDLEANPIANVLQMNIFDAAAPGVAYPTLPPMTEAVYANIPYRQATGIPVQYLLRNFDEGYSELRFQPLPYKPLTAQILCKQILLRVSETDLLTELSRSYSRTLKYRIALDLADIYGKQLTPSFMSNVQRAQDKLVSTLANIDYTTRRDEQLNRKNIVYFNWWI